VVFEAGVRTSAWARWPACARAGPSAQGGGCGRGGPAGGHCRVSVDLFKFSNLSQVPGVVHAISTRHGGISSGRCESLNVSYNVGDSAENVDENLRRIAGSVDSQRQDLFAAYQVHGRSVTIVDADSEARPRCDVLI